MEENKTTNELVLTNTSEVNDVEVTTAIDINNINMLDPKHYALLKLMISNLAKSKKSGISSVEDGIAIFARAKELSVPFFSACEHIHIINGKTGLDVHLMKTLLLKAGVIFNKIKDYDPQYEYTDSNNIFQTVPSFATLVASKEEGMKLREKDPSIYPVWIAKCYSTFNNQLLKENQLTDKHKIVFSRDEAVKLHNEGFIPIYYISPQPIDYVTEYEFIRIIHGREMKCIGRFTYNDAVTAGLTTDTSKASTYGKYAKVMISHRAFTYGAREIANDLLMGCMETSELNAVNGRATSDDYYMENPTV